MPDTAEAVAQYGSAVYRLAYAMTRSRSARSRRLRARFFSSCHFSEICYDRGS